MKLDPDVVTTNGQTSLPLIGGVSQIKMEPFLAFPKYISYGTCETYAWGRHEGDVAITTIRASVADVQLTTSPSPEDFAPDVAYFSFTADRFSIEIESIHPQTGQPSFGVRSAEASGLSLVEINTRGEPTRRPVVLEFDETLLPMTTMEEWDNEFLTNREFFERQVEQYGSAAGLEFGKSKLPRTREGYYCGSIVKQIRYGDEIIPGNTLTQAGFGTLSFGVVLADDASRRISMARVRMGSDPGGDAGFTGVETNGIWQ